MFRDYHKIVDVFVDKNRDMSPLLDPVDGSTYPPLNNKILKWEERGEYVIPKLPYNFRNSIYQDKNFTPFRAPIVKIGL